MSDLHISHNALAQCIGELWTEYLEFCHKQQIENARINTELRKQYDKEQKLVRRTLPPWHTALDRPPVIHSVYDMPSFGGLMNWLAQQNAVKPKAKKGVR